MTKQLLTAEDASRYFNRLMRITNPKKGHASHLNNTVLSLWTVLNKYADLSKLYAYTSANCKETFGRSLWFTLIDSGKTYYAGYNSITSQIDIRTSMHGNILLSLDDNILDEPTLKQVFMSL